MDERLERELAAPYARLLSTQARQAHIDTLAAQVALHLRPGPSPYRDVISWWHRFTHLRLVRATAERTATLATKRSDEKMREHGPSSRPDYTIERAEPLEVR